MITSPTTARQFAQSSASQSVELQNAIDAREWETAANLCEDILRDVQLVSRYIDAKIEALNNER